MVVGYAAREGLRIAARYFPSTFRTIKRADVQIHKSLYGASGGRGVRYGRDIGSIAAGAYQGLRNGDDLDEHAQVPELTPGKFRKAHRGYKRGHNNGSRKYNRCYPSRRQSRSR